MSGFVVNDELKDKVASLVEGFIELECENNPESAKSAVVLEFRRWVDEQDIVL